MGLFVFAFGTSQSRSVKRELPAGAEELDALENGASESGQYISGTQMMI